MTTKAQKIRVGAFVAITAALLATVLIVFGGVRFWQSDSSYKIVFSGSVMGLEKGAQVTLNGMRIGRVDDIVAAPGDLQKVLVSITVKEGSPIHTDTKAILALAGITGLKVIDLREGSHTAPLLPPGGLISEGQTILDKLEKQATMIADQSQQLMEKANRIVDNLAIVTDPKNFEGMNEIITASRTMTNNLAKTSVVLDTMVSENRAVLKSSLANVDAATKSIDAATKNIDNATRTAANLMDVQVTGLLGKAGEVIAGLENMVRSNEGHLRSTVFDLRQASRNFKELSRDLRQKPSRILFSNTPGERKLP